MTQPRRTWTQQMIDHLIHMREVEKMTWDAIGAAFGVTGANCCTRYHHRQAKIRIAEAREAARARAAHLAANGIVAAPPLPSPPPAPVIAGPPLAVHRPRYFHAADNDIRSRIARQGLTAGFLGDPPPGRSALDQREAGK